MNFKLEKTNIYSDREYQSHLRAYFNTDEKRNLLKRIFRDERSNIENWSINEVEKMYQDTIKNRRTLVEEDILKYS